MKRISAIVLSIVLILTTVCGCGSDSSEDTFKVGAIYPTSGSNALLGTSCLAAVEIAVDFVNEDGGVHEKQVELISADAPDAVAATTEASRLIDKSGVKVIFGSLASGNALAIAGVSDKAGVPLIESGGIVDSLTDSGFKYVFRILDKGGLRGSAGVEYIGNTLAADLGIPVSELKIAIVHEESSYGTSVANGAKQKIEEMGMNLVASESYNTAITDMSGMVLKIKKAKPDVLLTVNYINDAVLLVDTLKQYNAVPKAIMGCGAGTTDPNFAMTIGDDSDGIFCTDMPTNLPLTVFEDEELKITVKKFRERFLAEFPDYENVPIAAEAAFAGAYTFMHNVMPNSKTLTADDMREAALATKLPMTTLGFGWDIGEDGQNYAAAANINQWQDGEVITVYPEKMKNGDTINVPLPISNN